MNEKEVGEIRRRMRRDRSNMPAVYGCYVNTQKEIISEFSQSLGIMPENEAEKYFALLKRTLSGTIGKNLIDITFKTAQVADSDEHKLLMTLRNSSHSDGEALQKLYRKLIDTVSLQQNYLILIGCDTYDVPFRGKDGETQSDNSTESYTFLLCAVCPVKQNKPTLNYTPESREFHDGGITNTVSAPEIGFLFPAFDDRRTNIYNALYYTHSPKESHEAVADTLFHAPIPKPAYEQKKSFEALLSGALKEECDMELVQTVHNELCQLIELHKESRVPDTLLVGKNEVKNVLTSCGVSEPHIAKFSVDYDEAFGFEADLHPENIIDKKHFEVKLPDVSIKVAPDRTDLIETRVIGGVKYILINADEDVEVNGVRIHITDEE
jgi:hypothetical protein